MAVPLPAGQAPTPAGPTAAAPATAVPAAAPETSTGAPAAAAPSAEEQAAARAEVEALVGGEPVAASASAVGRGGDRPLPRRAEQPRRVLVSFQLKEHRSQDGGPVDLVRRRAPGEPLPFAVVGPDGAPSGLADALFAVERGRSGEDTAVTFRYRGPDGAAVKRFVFHPGGLFDVSVAVGEPESWRLFVGPGLRNPTAAELGDRFAQRSAAYERGTDVENLDPRKGDEVQVVSGVGMRWVALEDNYFLAALMPRRAWRRSPSSRC